MSLSTDTHTLVSLATYSASGVSHGFAIGCYRAGTLFIYVQSLIAPSRLTPRVEVSPNGNWARVDTTPPCGCLRPR